MENTGEMRRERIKRASLQWAFEKKDPKKSRFLARGCVFDV